MMHKWRASLFTFLLVGALGLIFLSTGLAFAAPPAGTISYWKLDETVAGAPGVADAYEDVISAPDGNNGEVPAAPKTAPLPNLNGIVEGAQDFDGVADAIDVPDPGDGSFDFDPTDSFTIECWMKSTKAFVLGDKNQVLVGREDYLTPGMQWWLGMEGFGGSTTAGNVTFLMADSDHNVLKILNPDPVAVPINDGSWHHLVAIYDGTNDAIYLYVDGVKVDEELAPGFTGGFAVPAGANLNLGWLDIDPGYHYEGTLDEVALYNRALTPTEIQQHYAAGLLGQGIDDLEIEVTLLSPNGGEVIPSGSPYTIEWVAPPEAETFKLKFSSDNGATWELIEEELTGTSYESEVPTFTKNKTNCLIKVVGYDASGAKVGADTSDGTFTIAVLTVTSPNGGEVVPSGGTYDIEWETNGTESEVESVELFYSRDGGTTWKLIEEALIGNPGTYEWIVPAQKKNLKNCLVKVKALDVSGNKVAVDKSDAPFTIAVLEVTSPNGEETLTSGDTHTITWTTNETKADVAKVKLLYTKNGGETWTKIDALTEGDPETYEWLVPSVNNVKTECRVKVELSDELGNSLGKDKSDNDFTIEPAE